MGLEPLDSAARHDLLEILEDRYDRRSTIVTSQVPVEHWRQLIGDPTYADAVVHNATRIDLTGESLRKKRGSRQQTPSPKRTGRATTISGHRGSDPGDINPEHRATSFRNTWTTSSEYAPALEQLLQELRKDDILVVSSLDRLARSTAELLHIAEFILEKDAGLQSLEQPWADTTTPAGRMVLTMFAGVAEFERALIRHRTNEGRQAAKRRGVSFGRPQKLRPDQKALALSLIGEGRSISEVQNLQRPSGHHPSLPKRASGRKTHLMTSVDAPLGARKIFGTAWQRRSGADVCPASICGLTAAGPYGSSKAGSKSVQRARGTLT